MQLLKTILVFSFEIFHPEYKDRQNQGRIKADSVNCRQAVPIDHSPPIFVEHLNLLTINKVRCQTASAKTGQKECFFQQGAYHEPSFAVSLFCLNCRTKPNCYGSKYQKQTLMVEDSSLGSTNHCNSNRCLLSVNVHRRGRHMEPTQRPAAGNAGLCTSFPLRIIFHRIAYRLAMGRIGRADKPCFYGNSYCHPCIRRA
jgi:hypothetical protein